MVTYEKLDNGQIKASIEVVSYESKVYPNIQAIEQEYNTYNGQVEELEERLSNIEEKRDELQEFLIEEGVLETEESEEVVDSSEEDFE